MVSCFRSSIRPRMQHSPFSKALSTHSIAASCLRTLQSLYYLPCPWMTCPPFKTYSAVYEPSKTWSDVSPLHETHMLDVGRAYDVLSTPASDGEEGVGVGLD